MSEGGSEERGRMARSSDKLSCCCVKRLPPPTSELNPPNSSRQIGAVSQCHSGKRSTRSDAGILLWGTQQESARGRNGEGGVFPLEQSVPLSISAACVIVFVVC